MKGLLLFNFTAIHITFCCIRHTVALRKYFCKYLEIYPKIVVEWMAEGAQIDVAGCQSMLEMIEMIADE